MYKIKDIVAREILDSRGYPTIETKIILDNNEWAVASVPSGASTGMKEALELRDNDMKRYNGKGVLNAVNNVNTVIKTALVNQELDQVNIDKTLIKLDGTDNKSHLGANAMLSVSLASIKALAKVNKMSLYKYLSGGRVSLPIPFMNIINGGRHAAFGLSIQEFMIVPVVKSFSERLRCGSEVFHALQKLLIDNKLSVSVGDEGGFVPVLNNTKEALNYIMAAIKKANYEPGKDVFIAIDAAASEFYDKKSGTYTIDNKVYTSDELMKFYLNLVSEYPIISIEDPFYEEDFESLSVLTKIIGSKIMLVGDDYFVTNIKYLQKGIDENAGNAILLKANQIGTVTEMIKTVMLARKNNFKMVISHRSGETMDTFIADFAVGLNIPFIKTGSLSRGERICKYNRLMEIENELVK